MLYTFITGLFIRIVFNLFFIPGEVSNPEWVSSDRDTTLWVTATAYNAIESQTKKGNVGIGAWGDLLTEDTKAIAVSKDLIEMGLTRNRQVKIEGLEEVYTVLDKMNARWHRKIDVFMGKDRDAAIQWGRRKVRITFSVPE